MNLIKSMFNTAKSLTKLITVNSDTIFTVSGQAIDVVLEQSKKGNDYVKKNNVIKIALEDEKKS